MNIQKKALSLILALALVIGAFGGTAVYAAESDFSITENGILCEYTGHSTKVVLPSEVTEVQVGAFSTDYSQNNSNITDVEVESRNQNYTSIGGVLYTSDKKTLVYCPPANARTSYTIPEGVTTIGSSAFQKCKKLRQVTIPQSVTEIGSYAFDKSGITSAVIPNRVTEIKEMAYAACDNLTEVTLSDSVTSLAQYAFCSDKNLAKINIPKSVTSIGQDAVYGGDPVIYGDSGSAAETYASKNGILFQASGADPVIGAAPASSASDDEKLEYAVSRVFSHLRPNMSNIEKVKAVHDYMVRNVSYDLANLQAGTIPWVDYGAYGALVNKKAVCSGYTAAFQLLMERLGIPVTTITSSSMNHAWNMIQLDDSWYHVDVTWDGALWYGCFLKSDAVIANAGHGLGLSKPGHYDWYSNYKATNTKYDSFDWMNATPETMNEGKAVTTATVQLDTTSYLGKVGKSYTIQAKSNIGESMTAASYNGSVVRVTPVSSSSRGTLFKLTFLKAGTAEIKVRSVSGAKASLAVTVS